MGGSITDGTVKFSVKTVCDKQYVDALNTTINTSITNKVNAVNTNVTNEAKKWRDAYNNLRKRSYPTVFDDDELTVIMNTPIGSGNITLSQPYTNFDGLLIVCTNDNHDYYTRHYISSTEITCRKDESIKLKHPTFYLFDGNIYWILNANSSFSTTFFPENKDNCIIECIYGVKFKEIT